MWPAAITALLYLLLFSSSARLSLATVRYGRRLFGSRCVTLALHDTPVSRPRASLSAALNTAGASARTGREIERAGVVDIRCARTVDARADDHVRIGVQRDIEQRAGPDLPRLRRVVARPRHAVGRRRPDSAAPSRTGRSSLRRAACSSRRRDACRSRRSRTRPFDDVWRTFTETRLVTVDAARHGREAPASA